MKQFPAMTVANRSSVLEHLGVLTSLFVAKTLLVTVNGKLRCGGFRLPLTAHTGGWTAHMSRRVAVDVLPPGSLSNRPIGSTYTTQIQVRPRGKFPGQLRPTQMRTLPLPARLVDAQLERREHDGHEANTSAETRYRPITTQRNSRVLSSSFPGAWRACRSCVY
jgi:hypothetical protein